MIYQIEQTETFAHWHNSLADLVAKHAITRRIDRAAYGNLGDVKPIREGVCEMRIDIGKGYRVYFVKRGRMIIFLLCGGDKSTQKTDIDRAIKMTKEI